MAITSKELAELKRLAETADGYAKDDWMEKLTQKIASLKLKRMIRNVRACEPFYTLGMNILGAVL